MRTLVGSPVNAIVRHPRALEVLITLAALALGLLALT
jgi:hypothetical protein